MASHESAQERGFTLTWRIENFLYRTLIVIRTPDFCVESLENSKWILSLVDEADHSVSFNLYRTAAIDDVDFKDEKDIIDVHFIIHLLNVSISSDFSFKLFSNQSVTFLLNAEELKSQLSRDGSLLIQCFMCNRKGDIMSSQLKVRTYIGVGHHSQIWKVNSPLERDSTYADNLKILPETCGSKGCLPRIDFCYTHEYAEYPIVVTNNTPLRHAEVSISILDAKMNVISSVREQVTLGLFQKCVFPLNISRDLLRAEKDLYMPNNVLSLLCELTHSIFFCSTDIVKSFDDEADMHKICTPETNLKNRTNQTLVEDLISESIEDNRLSMPLIKDLESLYREGKFSDVTLRVEDHTFTVHKNILSARSPIFRAMFDNDILERTNKEVDISDLDKDTMDRFLQYIYSETLPNLDWYIAKKLYFAADKYEVLSLRSRCSSYLKSDLSLGNVCEALVLSDLHSDEDLKKTCQDFINKNAKEVFQSKEWELLTVNNPLLSARIIQNFFSLKTDI